jgi:hypothetical protein
MNATTGAMHVSEIVATPDPPKIPSHKYFPENYFYSKI